MGLKALLWDVDGTLAETEFHGHRRAFNEAFAGAGLPWRWDVATYGQLLRISGGRERIRHFLNNQERTSTPVSAELVDALMAAKQMAYARLARGGVLPLRPGVRRLVAEAAAEGLPQALVTTSSRSAVAALLEGQDPELAEAFSFWICGEDVTAKKPSPEGYQKALEHLQMSACEVLVLEDSPQGWMAAKGASLPCLLTLGEQPDRPATPWWEGAAAAVNHLGEQQNPTEVLHGPPCQEGRVTLSWIGTLLEAG